MQSLLRIVLAVLPLTVALVAQEDAALRIAFDSWQARWKTFTEAMTKARSEGRIQKGGELPADVAEAQKLADDERSAIVARFDDAKDLSAPSYLLLAQLHEAGRDYAGAVTAYAKSIERGDPEQPDLGAYGSICIAAMNSKDDILAADWMRRLIALEDTHAVANRDLAVRTSYYPRTLIALEDWKTMDAHLAALAKDPTDACRNAAETFGFVADLKRGELTRARKRLTDIRADLTRFPDQQTWAVLGQLALDVHDGHFDEAVSNVQTYLAECEKNSRRPSAVEQNQRRYLAAIAPFLGKPVPHLRVDHQVGGHIDGDDVLATLRDQGKVIVLDFWQPWCEPCRKAMPEMVAAQTLHAKDLQVLGVCRVENYGYDVSAKRAVRPIAPDDYPAHVEDFRSDMGLNYPLLVADTADNNTSFAIAGVPTLVIVDRAGIVRYMSCGAGEPGLFRLALEGVLAATN